MPIHQRISLLNETKDLLLPFAVCLMRPLSFAASGMYLLNVMQTPAGSVTMRIKYALLVPHQQVQAQ